tara:strand:- start:1283 stop:1480 length:198 start_codon:yes stop_codon:yes gene_type:complete
MLLTPYHRRSRRIRRKRGVEKVKTQDTEEKSDDVIKNLCTECGIDMGDNNPRQLCGKTYCIYDDE